jgi:hypothetical protein
MAHHTIFDYIDALANPLGVFRTLGAAPGGEPHVERDLYGAPRFRAGNSAAVFTYLDHRGRRRMLKCYIRPNPHLGAVYAYVERHRPPLLPAVRLLPDELFVHSAGGGGEWVDVAEGEWVEGQTLARAAGRAAKSGDAGRLAALAEGFDALWRSLAAAEWAHGDLKPDNVVVRPGGDMTLVDCDALWIQSLAGAPAAELGTPPWRHPMRSADRFDKGVDLHPAHLIAACLGALAGDPGARHGFTTLEDLASRLLAAGTLSEVAP